jgi:hypothetical protein
LAFIVCDTVKEEFKVVPIKPPFLLHGFDDDVNLLEDSIGTVKKTTDFLACSVVPQPTTLPLEPRP